MDKIKGNYDRLSIMEKRISYLVGARLRDKDRIGLAMARQDKIREYHPAFEGWDSVSVIRKWRESH